MAQSGQETVDGAGTAQRIAANQPGKVFVIRALPDNTGTVYVGNDGADDVSATTGFPLGTSDAFLVVELDNLNQLWVDAATNDDGVAWFVLA